MSKTTSRLDELTPEQRRLLALRLQKRKAADAPAPAPAEDTGEYPLSFAQQRLWMLERLSPGGTAYNLPAALRVRDRLQPEHVVRAVNDVVRRHGALRTRFEQRGDESVQVVEPYRPVPVPVDDLAHLPEAEREAALARIAHDDANAPFNLEQGPPFRARVVRMGPGDVAILVNMHHIVSDGWSMEVFWREITAFVVSYEDGNPPNVRPLPISFGEHARRQRERLAGDALTEMLAWWRSELDGAPHLLDLPTDHPRPAVASGAGAFALVALDPALGPQVHEFALAEVATPFMVLLAAYQLLLGRYAGRDDLLVGTAIAGRDTRDVEPLIGFFANTLAVRGDLTGNPTFRELVQRVRAHVLGAFAHQDLPFERLVEELSPERSLAWSPLVQTVFLARTESLGAPQPGPAPEGAGSVEGVRQELGSSKFDLTFTAAMGHAQVAVGVEYATDLFDRGTVERLARHYGVLLTAAVARPDVPVGELSMLADEERSLVAGTFADGPPASDTDRSIAALFAAAARATPDAPALEWDGGRMTYADLDAESSRLAYHLRARGARAGDRVGVMLERGPSLVASMLAVLKAGCAYVPLDPQYPAERLAFMLTEADAHLLIASAETRHAADGLVGYSLFPIPYSLALVDLSAARADLDAAPTTPPAADPGPDALAYVIYTSGSTGRPKGVGVPHRAVVRLVRRGGFAEPCPETAWLHLAPATFDATTLEVWAPLLNGGRVVLYPDAPVSPKELGEAIHRHGVTHLWLTAGLFHLVADEAVDALAGVRHLLAGGDVLSIPHARRVMEAHPALRLTNGYGPTENTTFTTCHDLSPADWARASLPVGRPIAGTRAYVLDERMRPVPVGVPGELYAGGEGLAWGYLGRPALTAERFVPDPFGAPGSRLYRTGDGARWLADGALEFLGRADQQVKVRGYRIEVGEIEQALREDPRVGDAAVLARADGPGEKRLVGYVVPRDGARVSPNELREALSARLPAYMVPGAFVLLDALPLTANGKVDRRALPAPHAVDAGDAFVPPRTPTEEVVAGIWTELLRAERVGAEDDFFALGGHSLIATQLISRVRAAFGVELPLRDVFEAPLLGAFADRVDAAVRQAAGMHAPPLVAVGGQDLPLSFAQERLWFIDRLEPGNPVYNMPFPLRMRGALDGAAMERALGEIVRRHDSLRTRFAVVDGRPVQRVEPADGFRLPVDDLAALPADAREAEWERRVQAWATAPFDLERGPLFRARLLRLADDDHVLLIGLHHVVSDGWSMGIFWRELTTLYRAFAAGEPSPLPEPALQYADFAVWQRQWLSGETLERQVAWWREHLSGAPALLELPTDRPRPATQSHRGAGYGFVVPAYVAESVRSLARREGATLFMALLAAWDVLLSRWSGQDDVVVGTPVAGRTRRETEGLMGFFVNTLAIRGDLSGDPSFTALLGRVREATLGAYAHQDLPFERLVEELQPERSLSHAPVYQSMLVLQNLPDGPTEGFSEELTLEGAGVHPGVAKVDVMLGVMEGADGALYAGVEYATDLWDRGTMERLGAHFTTLLRAAAATPDAPVSALPLMTDEERDEVIRMGAAVASHPVTESLHARFATRAARTPDAPAVTLGERTLSYGELDARANDVARRLVARGAGPDVLVGLCVERSLETVVGILGILKAGAAYLPLDPAYPDDRLAYMLDDSGARLVVTTADAAPRLPDGVAQVRMDDEADRSEGAPFAPVQVGPDALAYVIYTSGSTGRPKGVQVTHGNVVRLFTATDEWFRFGAADVWTLFHSYAFDFSVWELWGALLYGGRLVVVPFETSRDPARFLALLQSERVTVLNQTPSAFRQLIRADEDTGGSADLSLRYVVFGGEALDPASLRGWVARRGDDRPRLVNMYGITETTVHVTWREIREADVRAGASSPIGIPIPDLSVHLLDRRGQPVPVGIVGEMHVGGAGVARGYLGRPELTAQRFIPDPFGTDADARLYRSGDLARRLPDGSLEFWGRADDQVKVRGFRIELGEIESVLLEHPAVREAVVLARGGADDRRLVAWTVADGAGAAELRAHLLAHLPEYMVPSAFVPVDALPLTRNGKVDRRALPEPDAADVAGAAYVAPRTPTEEVLAGIWAELLGAERVGAADGFFELGGHSLLATRVISRVRADFGVEVPVRAVFEHPVLESFAAELDRLLRASAGTEAPPLRPAPRDGDLPLSFAQERLWFVDQMEPGSPVYHMPFQYFLRGALDVGALRRAFCEVVRRHEVLRTTLPMVDDVPMQRIAPFAPVELPLHDLLHLAPPEREEAARRISDDVATRAFDLAAGPLWRAALVRVEPAEHLLFVNLHHVISDGWSTGVLWNELSVLYGAFARGEAAPLPELPVQYGDFAVWQRAWLTGDVLEAQLGYWRRKLAGAPPLLELPTDRPRPAVQTYAGAAESAVLEGAEAAAVLGLARREGATLFMVLLAALDVVLGRLAGQEDVVVGTPIAGRTRRETEGLIGLFLNSLALRTDLSGQPSFRELLRRVRETTLEAYAHQDLPFERILEEVHPERSLSHTPVFQVMLNLSNFAEGDVSLPGLEVHPLGTGGEVASKFDMTLYAGEGPGGVITLHLVYNVALFDASRVREMLAQLTGVLRQAAEDVERPVGSLSLLTDSARSVLPDPAQPLSADWRGSVPEIFAGHAARAPHARAVEDPAERWTYGELDADASRIARLLIAGGVRPGDVVAIHGHRSAALVRALMGTLRAGAAFLVLDPAYPAARLAEYVRIAKPTGWLPIDAAGPVLAELAEALDESVRATVPLGPRAGAIGAVEAPRVEIGPDSLAYLSFTSGTTGRPKAVMGRHGSLTHFTPWLAERFELGADDRFSLLSGLAHDPLHRDVFTPLQLGAAVVAPDPDETGTPGYLAEWMRDARISVAHLTPAMGQLLADVPSDAEADTVDSLRRAFFVGDVLTRTDVDRLHRLAPQLRIINYYGSTETQRAVAHFVVPRDTSALPRDIIPVGVGIPGVQVLVRTAAGERAGVGEVGEMWMRSPHIGLGYLGDPELTAARFVDGAYRTGDLGRYRPDGVAEIAGRADQQVKIRGFRIEPGEIEAALRAHPSVRDAVVVARGEGDGRRLVAYVVPEDPAPAADAFRAHLRGQVPDYMVPAAWVFMGALPVTPNGKVDRRALPEPETSAPVDAPVAPRTPTETALAEIWSALLRTPVGAHDDFFALGGHSLLATRLIGRVRDALGVELPLRAIFQSPTLAALAARVDDALRGDAAAGPPPIVPRAHGGQAPASFAQERMWFVDRLEGGGPVYHIPSTHQLHGPVDVQAMRRALEEVVRRHEALRTSLPETDGVPVQRIAPMGTVEMPFIDLSHLSPEERGGEVARLSERNANEPFDLEAGPLYRVSLVRLDADEHLLLVNLHHAIGDGWSMRVLLGELSALHDAYRRGDVSPLPALPVQYADYAAWQREWLRGPVLDAQLAYWRGRLADAPPLLRLPTDRPRPEVQGHRGASEDAWMASEDAARVADLARREGATVFMVLLAALDIVLSRWSGQEDVVVGTPIAGRTRPELEGLIGLFLNSLALRTDLSGQPTFAEVLRRVRETTLEAFAHQDLPFERILEDLRPERSLGHTPVFQVMLNLLNYGDGDASAAAAEQGGGGTTALGAGTQLASKFDLTLYAAERPDGIGLHAVYDADLFDAPRMRALLAQLSGVLRQAADDPDVPVAALSLATEADTASDASPVVVRTAAGTPAGVGELGEVCLRGPDGSLRPMGGAGRYRPDGSVELAVAPVAPPTPRRDPPTTPAAPKATDVAGGASRSETERMVAEVWAEVLGIAAEGIAPDADFFALGGHSLRATQVLARIRARTGARVPVKTFFADPTVAALAAAVDAAQPAAGLDAPAAAPRPDASAVSPTMREPLPHSRTDGLTHFPPGVYPLSFAQQRLWVLMQLGTSVAYNMASAVRFGGPLDDWALERALDELVRRHETLRTRIEVRDGEPVQVVQPARPLRLRAEEVRADGDTSVDDVLKRMAEAEAARPFPLEGPFLRVRLLRAADDDHVLLWTTHHMVSDGWSLGVFQAELTALYRSFVSGEPSPLQPLPIQYGQHALQQRRALSGAALDALVGWWKDRLTGAPALLELPTDRPRPSEPSGEGASFWFSFPEGTAERVARLARAHGATPFMVLLAAFQALLSRWSGQDDLVVGTPIANRTRPELEGLIGFFANTLAIRGDVRGDPTFAALLERVREATLGAYDHQDIPFERLVEELNPERSLSHSPVFQVMFALQNAAGGEAVEIEGITLGGLPRAREAAKYDLTLNVLEQGGQVHGMVEYAVDLFDAPTMERLVGGLVVLLDAALRHPETPVSALPLLDDDDRRELAALVTGPRTPVPGAPLHASFEDRAAQAPEAVALVYGQERITYGELDARANRLANLLRARGVGPDQPVAVLMERSVEMVVALYGILKAGGAYVPVDPAYPADRVAYMLEDSAAPLVLTQARWMETLGGRAEAVALDEPGVLDAWPAERPSDADAAGTERLAYVIYTSGSTGRPKGAMNAHRGVVNRIAWMQDAFGLTPDDAVLQKTPFSFDVSVWEFFWPLAVGARLVIAPPGVHGDPVALNELIRREGITTLHFVPSMLRAWLDGADASACTSLRGVMSSGEALPADLVTRFYQALPSGQLHNLYGPTEAAVDVTHWPCTPDVGGGVPIGRPIANTRMYVLDARGEPAPVGVLGELWIAGVQVGRGYWRRPGLTAERFVPDPFAPEPGARMYRTGDRARWRTDGTLEYRGRTDFQVKVRGFRIEPGEIEAVLATLPGVRQAVVDARPAPGGARLVAWIAADGDARPSPESLRAGLLRSLPDHMVPSVFVPVDALPLTPSGKVDRRALPEPAGAVGQGGGYTAPQSPTEQLLAEAWAELLGVERVGATDGFFALGGHSLLATRLVSRIRDLFGVELSLRVVFEAPVLRDLAARVERAGREGDDPFAPPPLTRVAPENDAPLSFAQERLWFIDRLDPGSPLYNMSPSLRLGGPLDPAVLEAALREVVRRHEPLRTSFPLVDGRPVQRIGSADDFCLAVEDLSGLSPEEREGEASRMAAEWGRMPFDLEHGPLFRARLLRIGAEDHALLLGMHHAVSDGWSNGILFRELFALYDAFAGDAPSPLAPLPIRYADYAAWQRGWLAGEVLDRQVAYWRETLAGAPALLALPADRPRPATMSRRGAMHAFVVPADVAASVRALARREGATLFMALLAAWDVVLSRASGQEDVVVGTPVAGRTRGETEGLIGLFVNTLALRTDLSGDPPFLALLERVRGATLGAFAHQDLPFEKLVEELKPERSLAYTPVFQALFNLQNTGEGPARAPAALSLAPVSGKGAPDAKVDVTLTVTELPDGALHATLGYAADLFHASTAERMAAWWTRVLAGVAARPDMRVSEIGLLSDEEHGALAAWNRTERDFPAATALELFDGWVARTPDAPALAFEGERLTFAELDARTRRIAGALVARGVRPEARVGLCVERSAEMIVALLGILRAGAAYVPLDPAFPPARMADMLADAGASLVLAQDALPPLLEGIGAEVVTVGAIERNAPESVALPRVRPEWLAYVIYTSGSTGRPKGVAVEHRQLAHYVQAVAERLAVPERASYATVSTVAADLGHTSVFGALCGGGCLHVIGGERIADARSFAAYVAENAVDVLKITPSHLAALMGGGDPAAVLPRRCLVLGGEASRAAWVDEIRALAPDLRVVNHYGPTETTVGALAYVADTELPDTSGGTVPIGRPLANARAYVVDAGLRPVSLGIPGELCIGGRGVARGYLGRPALTAERFVPDPFATEPGARMYRTGDRARWLADGSVEFLGRIDQQVKVRGFRVEPGEVESVLRAHPAVHAAAVVAHADPNGTPVLVAYVVGAEGAAVDVNALDRYCAAHLPAYMVPAAFVALDVLPLTPNGKLDRSALPAPQGAAGDGYVVPRDVTELEVARIWSEALGVPRVGANDDFFRLGGHSLLAVRMLPRIRERFGRDLPLGVLFQHSTVAAFAAALRHEGADADDGRLLVTLNAGGARPPLFFFPPAGGTVTHYADLARLLGPDQPFLALQAPGVNGAEAPLWTVEAMVERYLEEIRRAQPRGPYWLGGWSAGGLTAFEAARSLRAAGEAVALVAIVDAPAPDAGRDASSPDQVALYRRFAGSTVTGDEALLDALADELRALAPEERLAGLSRWIARHGGPVMDAELERVGRVMAVYEATARAVRDYRDPPPLDAPVVLFVAAEGRAEEGAGPDALPARWRPFVAGELAVHIIPGVHAHLVLEPAAADLADALREEMERRRA